MSQVLQCTQFCALICSRLPVPGADVVGDELVDAGGTVARLGTVVAREVHGDRDRRVAQLQVHRLVLLVIGVRQEHRRQLVEREHAVVLRIVDARHLRSRAQRLRGPALAVAQRPRRPARPARGRSATCAGRRAACPSHMPHFRPGFTLRTLYRSSYTHDLRHASGRSASSSCARPAASAANAASAASMPVFIALCAALDPRQVDEARPRSRSARRRETPASAPTAARPR